MQEKKMDEKKVREAIEFIKTLIVVGNGDKRLYTAIEALEKQLPKKPIFLNMTGETCGRFKCSCGNSFIHECPTFPYEHMVFAINADSDLIGRNK